MRAVAAELARRRARVAEEGVLREVEGELEALLLLRVELLAADVRAEGERLGVLLGDLRKKDETGRMTASVTYVSCC